MILILLAIFLAVAVRCPDTAIGGWLRRSIIAPLTQWFADLTWRRGLVGLIVSVVTIGLLMVAPELSALAIGMDLTIFVELSLLAGLNATRLRWVALRDACARMMTAPKLWLFARLRARSVRTHAAARPPRRSDSEEDPAGACLAAFG